MEKTKENSRQTLVGQLSHNPKQCLQNKAKDFLHCLFFCVCVNQFLEIGCLRFRNERFSLLISYSGSQYKYDLQPVKRNPYKCKTEIDSPKKFSQIEFVGGGGGDWAIPTNNKFYPNKF